jgi:hypothetical protein
MANHEGKDYTDVGLRAHGEHGLAHAEHGDQLAKKYESTDIELRPIVTTVVVLAVMTLASYIIVYGLYVYWQNADRQSRTENLLPISDGFEVPRTGPLLVEGSEAPDLTKMKAEGAKRVDSYGWVDQNTGVVHIPVERAMDIVAEKGLPSGAVWELGSDEVIIQGVIRKRSDVETPVPPGAVLPVQPAQNVPGGMVPGQPNSGAGQPATVVPAASNPGTANPGEGTTRMHSGFGGPSAGAKKKGSER